MREMQECQSVQEMGSERLRGFVTPQDLNNRPGQIKCGRGLRYEGIRANQSRRRRRFVNAEKYDPGRGSEPADLFRCVEAAHNGHRQVENHNVGR